MPTESPLPASGEQLWRLVTGSSVQLNVFPQPGRMSFSSEIIESEGLWQWNVKRFGTNLATGHSCGSPSLAFAAAEGALRAYAAEHLSVQEDESPLAPNGLVESIQEDEWPLASGGRIESIGGHTVQEGGRLRSMIEREDALWEGHTRMYVGPSPTNPAAPTVGQLSRYVESLYFSPDTLEARGF